MSTKIYDSDIVFPTVLNSSNLIAYVYITLVFLVYVFAFLMNIPAISIFVTRVLATNPEWALRHEYMHHLNPYNVSCFGSQPRTYHLIRKINVITWHVLLHLQRFDTYLDPIENVFINKIVCSRKRSYTLKMIVKILNQVYLNNIKQWNVIWWTIPYVTVVYFALNWMKLRILRLGRPDFIRHMFEQNAYNNDYFCSIVAQNLIIYILYMLKQKSALSILRSKNNMCDCSLIFN